MDVFTFSTYLLLKLMIIFSQVSAFLVSRQSSGPVHTVGTW